MSNQHRPLALIILDGFGYREEKEYNAIALAHKPNWDRLWDQYPHTLLSGSGSCVGLPTGQMGNSEVGHLNMGAGRVVHQDLTRIDLAIEDKSFFDNKVLKDAILTAIRTQKKIHILGLLSPGGVHSHEHQIHALLQLIANQGTAQVYIHAFLDGRDTPPKSAEASLKALMEVSKKSKTGKIATIIGRYYAMDRDKRWERVQKAYHLITQGLGEFHFDDPISALLAAYQRGETDEFVKPTVIHAQNEMPPTIDDSDTVIFMNFRADRAREITRALIDPEFTDFQRDYWPKVNFVTLTEYDVTFKVKIAYPPESLLNIFGEYISHLGLRQLRIAETEKYAHVTFFFNGGIEKAYPNEDRVLIPSPKVATYDLKPEMSAFELTDRLIKETKSNRYDVIICNFANPDMVGHTGNLPATIKAIESIDTCLGKIIPALLEVGGEALITSDHGNAEKMFDPKTGQPHTAHTHELVPLLYIGRPALPVKNEAILSDIAPTMLSLLDISIPKEMNGTPLFKLL